MNKAKLLIRISAIYAVIGVFIGSHMAGAGSHLFRPIHTHILVVGWLSLFAFGIFYAVFKIPRESKLASSQVWTAVVGSFGLTTGMWMYYFNPSWAPEVLSLIYFIVGGTILVISFFFFLLITFKFGEYLIDRN
ncbi:MULTISPECIES: hypothetical protein [Bacillaceae]|uniref:Cbb3-type cytochrome c oxidase subunit I n=1 Tax=Evansella alkalicola TaxID=745819 RepID=A0ABS6JQR8_9BACI|nr:MULTISPECIES: hypothetical protein [Bacillaceae]MBU9720622.1 hypothetical protein [Bacillus alkalicola]